MIPRDNVPEHPDVRAALRTGYPARRGGAGDCRCPLCGAEAEEFFVRDGEIVGCGQCTRRATPWMM